MHVWLESATFKYLAVFFFYEGNLEATLMETEQLLGELSVMCRQKQPKITNFASVVQTLQKDVDLETDELAK